MDSNPGNYYNNRNYNVNGTNTYNQYQPNSRESNQYGQNMEGANYGMGTGTNYMNNNANHIYSKPRTSNQINRPFSKQELNNAKEALRSWKMKMGDKQSRQVTSTMAQQGAGNRDSHKEWKYDAPMNYGGEMEKPTPLSGNNNRMGGYGNQRRMVNNNYDSQQEQQQQMYSANRQNLIGNQRVNVGNVPKTTTGSRGNQIERMGYIYDNNNNNHMGNKPNIMDSNINYKRNNYDNPNNNYNNYNYNNNYNNNNNNNNNHMNMYSNSNEDRAFEKGPNAWNEINSNWNPSKGEPTYPCPDCGKRFVSTAYEKHVKICKKVFQNKRKAFDPKKQRILDSEHANLMKQGVIEDKKIENMKKKKAKQIPKWKKQSEELRQVAHAEKSGNPVAFQPSTASDDYVLCNFCNRKYNQMAYDKHKDGCERRYHDAQLKNRGNINSRQGNQNGGGNNRFGRK